MSNPFDDADAQFYVLVNEEAQHSLWPVFAAIPGGWAIAHGPAERQNCLDFVEAHWTDMRPISLIEVMAENE
ncbi:MbtH family protein [Nocardia otitidiscaviarum]|uniref:MbtH family protein n=1 Tax=Nocardia otitidiscaviarum TaxID=1823 RepID=UPI001894B395|nr:MbtH family protein [Nocardia otitidiscaviarum]MBF6240076.1 MbtH family protein [Nocardia otitidiscaviarum]